MNDHNGYAVFFFPQALEALGDAVRPFLLDGPAGPHIACTEVDTGGAFIEMTVEGRTNEGKPVAVELMVPSGMVRMIVSTQFEAAFGFGLRRSQTQALVQPQQLPQPAPQAHATEQTGLPGPHVMPPSPTPSA
jgi:hypothetical protein